LPPASEHRSTRPVLAGLTGAIAAGKSAALEAFARHGAATLSSDAVVHELLGSDAVREQLVERWGDEVAAGGSVDRARVGAIVFERPEELAWLESLLHPLVAERLLRWRTELPPDTELAVVEVPLLFEVGMEGAFDAIVSVVADDAIRKERAAGRGTELLEGRSGRQLSQEEKATLATDVLKNDGSLEDLDREVERLAGELRRRGEGNR
jgi:dephospho-CoA kinase